MQDLLNLIVQMKKVIELVLCEELTLKKLDNHKYKTVIIYVLAK